MGMNNVIDLAEYKKKRTERNIEKCLADIRRMLSIQEVSKSKRKEYKHDSDTRFK